MSNQDESSGLSLLAVYTVLVIVSVAGAIGLMFVADKAAPSYAGTIFIVAVSAALVVPWPVAVFVTGRASRTG